MHENGIRRRNKKLILTADSESSCAEMALEIKV
jgi:hypothetical protein